MIESSSVPLKRIAKGKTIFSLFSAQAGSLWLGPDHLLYAIRTRYSESYKRFYFRDIQAITICRTENGAYLNALLALITLGVAILTYFLSSPIHFNQIYVASLSAFPLLFLAYNVALGPTCKCKLYTAVQVEPILAFTRLRKTQKTLQSIYPLIEAEQGVLNESFINERPEASRTVKLANKDIFCETNKQYHHYEHGTYHLAFFLLLASCAISSLVYIWFEHPAKILFDIGLYTAAFLSGIKAMTRQKLSFMTMPLRQITLAGLATQFALMPIMVFLYEIQGIYYLTGSSPSAFILNSSIGGPIMNYVFAIMSALFLLISAIGLIRLMNHRRSFATHATENVQTKASV
jgi:hypothetical protein